METNLWNNNFYKLAPSEGKLYWAKYGYLWYLNWLEWGDEWQDHWELPENDDGES